MNDLSIPRHPIRVVAQRTGLTPATIRAWERRYDAVHPGRSKGGQRLYSDREVERLRRLRELTEAGRAIGMVAGLSDEAVADLLLEDRSVSSTSAPPGNASIQVNWVAQAYAQVQALEAEDLERTLWRAVMTLGARTFLEEVAPGLLHRIGEGWAEGEITPGQEHLSSEVLEGVLDGLARRAKASDGPTLVVATLPGEQHGLGARLVSVVATLDGWNVVNLGTDLPVADIAATAEALYAAGVAISVVGWDDPGGTLSSLITLRELLNPDTELLVGGGGARFMETEELPEGVTVLHGLDGLGEHRGDSGAPRGRPES